MRADSTNHTLSLMYVGDTLYATTISAAWRVLLPQAPLYPAPSLLEDATFGPRRNAVAPPGRRRATHRVIPAVRISLARAHSTELTRLSMYFPPPQ
mmetsp:Transcript_7326/g.22338  ORF Transcript_7326/g.22338 Transcript_7326/m.22338 type:complete len:96 (-) Transcript_7326:55-342(-)